MILLPVIVKSVPSPSIFSASSPNVKPTLAGMFISVVAVKLISAPAAIVKSVPSPLKNSPPASTLRYFGISPWDEDQADYCLTAKYNADYNEGAGDSPNPFENIGPDEVLIPKIYKYVVEHNQDEYETEMY